MRSYLFVNGLKKMPDTEFGYTMVPVPDHGFFWVSFSGEMTIEGLASAHEEFTSHPDYVTGIDELLDFSQATIKNLTMEQIERFRSFLEVRPDRHNSKSVIVVNSQLEYGLARMMGGYLDHDVPVDRRVCYSVREALEWLRPGQEDKLLSVVEAE